MLNNNIKNEKLEDSWIGIDSLNGRYLTGGNEFPDAGKIACGAIAEISSRSQAFFRGNRLFVQAACAPDFLIHSVLVGNQIAGIINTNPIIAEPFAVSFEELPKIKWELIDKERAVRIAVDKEALELMGEPFTLPAMQAGMEIKMRIENIGSKPKRFLAAFLGKACY